MKKKLLALVLAVVMIISLLPVTTFAAAASSVKCVFYQPRRCIEPNLADGDTVYVVLVDDTTTTDDTTDKIPAVATTKPEDNYVKLNYQITDDVGTYTMTLHNFEATSVLTGTQGTSAFFNVNSSGNYDIVINLEGTNKISGKWGIFTIANTGDVTITGDGSLEMNCSGGWVDMFSKTKAGNLYIKDTTITTYGPTGGGQENAFTVNGSVFIENSTVNASESLSAFVRTATSRSSGLLAADAAEVQITNSNVVAITKNGANYPVIDCAGKVTITNSNVTLGAGHAAKSRISRTAPYLVGNYSSKVISGLGYGHASYEKESEVRTYDLTEGAAIDEGTVRYLKVVKAEETACTHANAGEQTNCAVAVTCPDCGAVVIEAKAHTPVTVSGYAEDCDTDGLTDGSECKACGETLTAQETIPATGHSYAEDGYCSVCGAENPEAPFVAQAGDKKYTTLAEAIAAAEEGGEVVLLDDLTAAGLVNINKAIILNLNGKTITRAGSAASAAALYVTADDAVIKNGAVTLTGNGIAIWAAADVEIDNVTVTGADVGIYVPSANSATVTVKNSTVVATVVTDAQTESGDGIRAYGESVVNIVNSTITGSVSGSAVEVYGTASVTVDADSEINTNGANYSAIVYGGTLTVNGTAGAICISEDAPEGVAAATVKGTNLNVATTIADSKVVCNDGVYTVVAKDYVAQVGEQKFESLADAIAAGGEVVLLKDLTVAGLVNINKAIILNLNGKTLTREGFVSAAGTASTVYVSVDGATIKNGTVAITNNGIAIYASADVEIDGVTVIGADLGIYAGDADVTVKNSDIKATVITDAQTESGDGIRAYRANVNVVNSTVTGSDSGSAVEAYYNAAITVDETSEIKTEGTNYSAIVYGGTLTVNGKSGAICISDDAPEGVADATVIGAEGLTVTATYGDKVLYTEGKYVVHTHVAEADDGDCTTATYCEGCGDEMEAAPGHIFDQKAYAKRYIKTNATLNSKAVFYYACICGESSKDHTGETYEYGEVLAGAAAEVGGVNYATVEEAVQKAQETGATVTLKKDVVDGTALVIENNVKIDFNGYSYGVIVAEEGAALVIKAGAVVELVSSQATGELQVIFAAKENFSKLVKNAGTLTVENVTLNGNNLYAEGDTYTVENSGTMTLNAGVAILVKDNGMKNEGTVTKAADAEIALEGFHWTDGVSLSAHYFDPANDEVVAPTVNESGYTLKKCACGYAEKTNIKWALVTVATVNGEKFGSVQEAVNAANAGDTVYVAKKMNNAAAIVIDKDITIDFGGFTYTVSEPAEGGVAIVVAEGANVTLTNGTVQIRYSARKNFTCLIDNNGTVNATNITLKTVNACAPDAVGIKGNDVVLGEGATKL